MRHLDGCGVGQDQALASLQDDTDSTEISSDQTVFGGDFQSSFRFGQGAELLLNRLIGAMILLVVAHQGEMVATPMVVRLTILPIIGIDIGARQYELDGQVAQLARKERCCAAAAEIVLSARR